VSADKRRHFDARSTPHWRMSTRVHTSFAVAACSPRSALSLRLGNIGDIHKVDAALISAANRTADKVAASIGGGDMMIESGGQQFKSLRAPSPDCHAAVLSSWSLTRDFEPHQEVDSQLSSA
jgi:hypothetical protein